MSTPFPFLVGPTGRRVYIENPGFRALPREELIREVAHGLAREQRFAGHLRESFSVAAHSCLVHRLAMRDPRGTLHAQDYALIHDASEAYLRDIPKPLKEWMPDYRAIERRFQIELCHGFGVSPVLLDSERDLVHELDALAMAVEADVLGFGCSVYGIQQPDYAENDEARWYRRELEMRQSAINPASDYAVFLHRLTTAFDSGRPEAEDREL